MTAVGYSFYLQVWSIDQCDKPTLSMKLNILLQYNIFLTFSSNFTNYKMINFYNK